MIHDPFVLPGDEPPVGMKLQKFLSAAGVASRRHAEVMIEQGRVSVNGVTAALGMRVVHTDVVKVNGLEVGPQAPRLYMLNKPVGVVTTLEDPQGRPTVAELVPDDVRTYPVGRLDQDTSGLLLLTNDGELAHRLMHPSFGVKKAYRALVEGKVTPQEARRLARGIELEDGMTAPAEARVVDSMPDRSILELVIHEGRNRQVRRMCDAIGHPVVQLVRTAYGPLSLGDLAPGTWRELAAPEKRRLRKAAGLQPPRRDARSSEAGGGGRPGAEAASAAGSEDVAVQRDGDADPGSGGNGDQQEHPKEGGDGTGRGARGHRGSAAGDPGSSGGTRGRVGKPGGTGPRRRGGGKPGGGRPSGAG